MSEKSFDLIVIGAGPGGYVAAIRAAQLGMKVACVEKHRALGGTCLNVGCIPSKALLESSERFAQTRDRAAEHGILVKDLSLDFAKLMERKDKVVERLTHGVAGLFKKHQITIFTGTATLIKEGGVLVQGEKGEERIRAKRVLIAAGSESIALPNLMVDQKYILDSTGALALKKIPKKLVVVGGGYIGLELGSVYLRLGSEVLVVEMLDRLIPNMDGEMAEDLHRLLKKQGMTFKFSTKVKKGTVSQSGEIQLQVEGADGAEEIAADAVLVAVGRKPNTAGLGLEDAGVALDDKGRIEVNEHYRSSQAGIYAIGDVIKGPMLAHKAMEEGVAVVERLAGQAGEVDYFSIPSVVYTHPEAASVGLHEEEVRELGIPFRKYKFPFTANGRALSLGDTEGWVKLLAHEKTDRLLGAHILGPRASDMIAELVLATTYSASAEDIGRTVHAHPTLAEAVKETALGLGSGPIHI